MADRGSTGEQRGSILTKQALGGELSGAATSAGGHVLIFSSWIAIYISYLSIYLSPGCCQGKEQRPRRQQQVHINNPRLPTKWQPNNTAPDAIDMLMFCLFQTGCSRTCEMDHRRRKDQGTDITGQVRPGGPDDLEITHVDRSTCIKRVCVSFAMLQSRSLPACHLLFASRHLLPVNKKAGRFQPHTHTL